MKRNLSKILSLILVCSVLSSCNNKEQDITTTTTSAVYVQEDLYGKEQPVTTTTTSEDLSVITNISSYTTNEHISQNIGTTSSNNNSTVIPPNDVSNYTIYENPYNTTCDVNVDVNEMWFDEVFISLYDEIEENTKSGITEEFRIDEFPYGFYKLAFLEFRGMSCVDETVDNEETEPDEKILNLDIQKDENNPYAFKFKGMGHVLKERVLEGEPVNFYLELQQNNTIFDVEGKKNYDIFKKMEYAQAYETSIKAIATKLGDFDMLNVEGGADIDYDVAVRYYIYKKNGNKEPEKLGIEVGMPFYKVTDFMGEGELIETVTETKDGNITVKETEYYHVYKNTEFTLVIQAKAFPEFNLSELPEDFIISADAPEETVLINAIFLIQNNPTVFALEDRESETSAIEELPLETSAATITETTTTIPETIATEISSDTTVSETTISSETTEISTVSD